MSLDAIWGSLPDVGWVATENIREATGLDEDRFNVFLNFLIRWKFVEAKTEPEYCVRRKTGVVSPMDVVQVLRTFTDAETGFQVSEERFRVAERVACRLCGHRDFRFLEQNLVECQRCHERQWYRLEFEKPRPLQAEIPTVERSGWLKRLRNPLSR
jgi:hypothetical protein